VDKQRVLKIAALVNYLIWIIVTINVVIVFPPNAANAWIYGIVVTFVGVLTYLVGVFLTEKNRLAFFGIILALLGEIVLLWSADIAFQLNFWISVYIISPAVTFLIFAIISYRHNPDQDSRQAINWGIMLVSAAFFVFMIETAIRMPDLSQNHSTLTWGIVIILAGLLLYALTTWRVIERPSYMLALAGAFIVNVGIILIEVYYRLYETTGVFTLLFVAPALVFFLLLLINYKRHPD
jgi:hypothetical protein